MPAQKGAVGAQALGHALRVVQPLHGEHDLAALVAGAFGEAGAGGLRGRLLRGAAEPLVVYPQRKRVGLHQPSLHAHRARAVLQPRDAPAAGKEMPHVVVGVEPHEVGAQHAAHALGAPRQHAERLVVGEGDVQEKPHVRPRQGRAHERGQEHEVVVLYPHRVARPRHCRHGVAKPLVHAHVGLPRLLVEAGALGKPVEQRPQRGVREPLVVQRGVFFVQVYRHAGALGQRRVDAHGGGRVVFLAVLRPSYPEVARALVQRPERAGQPSCAAREGDPARPVHVHAVGQAVRHDDLPVGRGRALQCPGLRRRFRLVGGRAAHACRALAGNDNAHGSTFAWLLARHCRARAAAPAQRLAFR